MTTGDSVLEKSFILQSFFLGEKVQENTQLKEELVRLKILNAVPL